MKNITEQQKAEARAYNDTIKNSMSIENKLELLYIDLIDYVANELGADKMEAIDNIVKTFKKNPYPWSIDDEIEVIVYEYRQIKAGKNADKFIRVTYTKAELDEAIKVVLTDKDTEKTAEAIADKYYPYFYENLDESLNKIIDNYTENGESLEPKVREFIAKKEAKA